MEIYNRFAKFYQSSQYQQYSSWMLEMFPVLLERYGIHKGKLLDLACGNGNFLIGLQKLDWEVTGIDQSVKMLEYARQIADGEQVVVNWMQRDMRHLDFSEEFDLVTCWFDSMNYLLTIDDLTQTFQQARKALKPGGWFIFDMNTIYHLAVGWQKEKVYIQQDTPDLFEIHVPDFNHETQTATLRIVGFARKETAWERMEEFHHQRGYPLDQVLSALQSVGLQVIEYFSNIHEFTKPDEKSKRIWFITKRAE